MYPTCVALLALLLIVFLLLFVFPKILPLITSGGQTLPLSTRLLISISDNMKEKGVAGAIIVIALVLSVVIVLKRRPLIKKRVQFVVLAIPFVSRMVMLTKSRFFVRLLSLFLESGYTLSESLYYAERLEKNLAYKEAFNIILKKVKSGERFSRLLGHYPKLFPKETGQFVALGEESGNLSKTLFLPEPQKEPIVKALMPIHCIPPATTSNLP